MRVRNEKRAISSNITFNPIESVHNALTRFTISNEYTKHTHKHTPPHFYHSLLVSRCKWKLDMFIVFRTNGDMQYSGDVYFSIVIYIQHVCKCELGRAKKKVQRKKKFKTGNSIPLSMSFELCLRILLQLGTIIVNTIRI